MRIWDLPASTLCRQHLLGEHRELHALWTILTQNKKGYMHHSPLDKKLAKGTSNVQDIFVNSPNEQITILRQKGCICRV